MVVIGNDVCNFAVETALFTTDNNLNKIINRLHIDALNISRWFVNSHMKLNEKRCHLFTFVKNSEIAELIFRSSSS